MDIWAAVVVDYSVESAVVVDLESSVESVLWAIVFPVDSKFVKWEVSE